MKTFAELARQFTREYARGLISYSEFHSVMDDLYRGDSAFVETVAY